MSTLAITRPTLLDVARITDPSGRISSVVNTLMQYNDILDDIPWVEGNLATGNLTTVQTSKAAPTRRLLNQGVAPTKSTTGQLNDACSIYENRNQIDINVAGLNGNSKAFRSSQDKPMMEGFSDLLATDLIYGNAATTPESFNGFATRYFSLGTTYTTSAQLIDGGGVGSDNTSIYLVGWGEGKVNGIYPKGSQAGLKYEDLGIQEVVTNTTTGATMRAYVSWMQWMCGLAVHDYRYVVRICNIDVSNLLTAGDGSDTSANIMKLMIRALGKLPPRAGVSPVFYMNETVQTMLAVKLLDKGNNFLTMQELKNTPVFRPNGVLSFQGVPCRRIDAILNTEDTITTATV